MAVDRNTPPYRWEAFRHWLNLGVLAAGSFLGLVHDPMWFVAVGGIQAATLWVVPDVPPFRKMVDDKYRLVWQFPAPACVIVKHNNPCGVGQGPHALEAFMRAQAGDPVSAFGGIVAFNRPVGVEVAKVMAQGYTNAEIAEHLHYSYNYVKKVSSVIFNKLGISRRNEIREFLM